MLIFLDLVDGIFGGGMWEEGYNLAGLGLNQDGHDQDSGWGVGVERK